MSVSWRKGHGLSGQDWGQYSLPELRGPWQGAGSQDGGHPSNTTCTAPATVHSSWTAALFTAPTPSSPQTCLCQTFLPQPSRAQKPPSRGGKGSTTPPATAPPKPFSSHTTACRVLPAPSTSCHSVPRSQAPMPVPAHPATAPLFFLVTAPLSHGSPSSRTPWALGPPRHSCPRTFWNQKG